MTENDTASRFSKSASLDVVGIGNAIVDILSQSEDKQLEELGIIKGAMNLIDEDRATLLYSAMGPAQKASGGSAGNTMAGVASLGGKGGYIGRIRNDQFGEAFQHDIRATGIRFENKPVTDGPSTGRCLIFITPDAERSMNTYLGACVHLTQDDIKDDMIKDAHVTYMEGYLFDSEEAKHAFIHAAEVAHANGRKVSITLSDSFCVNRHRTSFHHLVENHIDILFGNEDEILSLYEVDNFDAALEALKGKCDLAAITRGAQGSVVLSGDQVIEIRAEPVEKVRDTTGAGDLYAAGFLFGYTQGYSLERCGKIASIAAGEVISHIGPRPLTSLRNLIADT